MYNIFWSISSVCYLFLYGYYISKKWHHMFLLQCVIKDSSWVINFVSYLFYTAASNFTLHAITIEKVLTREETLGRFLYERRDSTWLYTRCILVLSRHKVSMWRWKVWWFLIKNALMTKTLSALNTTRNCLPELAGHFLSIFSLSMVGPNPDEIAMKEGCWTTANVTLGHGQQLSVCMVRDHLFWICGF